MAYMKMNAERRLLLSDVDDDCKQLDEEEENNAVEEDILQANHRHQIHRGARKLARFVTFSIGFLSFFLLVYIAIYNSVHSRKVVLRGWGYNVSRNTAEYILPGIDTGLITPKHICHDRIFLLVVVCSAVNNFEARQNIRETWANITEFNYNMFAKMHANMHGSYLDTYNDSYRRYKEYLNDTTNYGVQVVFIVGRNEFESHLGNESRIRLQQEADQYDDIIQENFVDTYMNLTVKSVMMLKWVNKYCADKTEFIMKCDDDTFVNMPNLLHFLLGGTIPIYNATYLYHDIFTYKVMAAYNRMTLFRNVLTGYLFCFVKPVANITSKWYAPIYMYPGDTYPKYLSGASYLMSNDVVSRLYETALNTTLFHLEDVYITGICAEQINLPRQHNPLFRFTRSKNICSFRGTITQHLVKGDLMREAYTFVTNMTKKCSPPPKYGIIRWPKRSKNCH